MTAFSTSRSWARELLAAVPFALVYGAFAAVTVRYTRFEGGVAFIWIAGPLLLARLASLKTERWLPNLIVAGLASTCVTGLFGLGWAAAVPLAIVNMGEGWLAAALLRRWKPGSRHFTSLGEIVGFLAIAGVAVPAFTAFAGAGIAHAAAGVPFWSNWLNWCTGHALGAITCAPLMLLVSDTDARAWVRSAGLAEWAEAATLLGLVGAVSVTVFAQANLPLLFLPFLPMMIAVFRLGRVGAAASMVMLTLIGMIYTIRGAGPISLIQATPGAQAQFLQFYLAIGVLMVLPAAGELMRRKELAAQLEEQSALYRLILDRTSDIVMSLGIDGTIRYVSPSIERVAGYAPATLIGTASEALLDPEDVEPVSEVHRAALADPNETFIVEYRGRRASGDYGWFEAHSRGTTGANGAPNGVVTIIREVTSRKQAERELARDATTDPLTGIANRRAFDRAVDGLLAAEGVAAKPGVLAVFDLDHFKSINDRYGHQVGDVVLQRFAALMSAAVRPQDVVARLGGEEFAAVFVGASLEQSQAICERIRARLAEDAMLVGASAVRATVSAGIAPLIPGEPLNRAIKAADDALYRAKRNGRNRLALAA